MEESFSTKCWGQGRGAAPLPLKQAELGKMEKEAVKLEIGLCEINYIGGFYFLCEAGSQDMLRMRE